MIVVRGSEAQIVEWRPGVRTRLHASDGAAPISICVLEQWCEPNAGAPTHTHFEIEELITVVEGTADLWIDEERTNLTAGDSALLPPHSWHGFRNSGQTTLHILAVFAAGRPLVCYLDEHDRKVLQIGASGGDAIDPHRVVRET